MAFVEEVFAPAVAAAPVSTIGYGATYAPTTYAAPAVSYAQPATYAAPAVSYAQPTTFAAPAVSYGAAPVLGGGLGFGTTTLGSTVLSRTRLRGSENKAGRYSSSIVLIA